MITKFNVLRNIGQFDSVTVPNTVRHERLTVIYSENGRGKTTLTAVLRSYATGNPLPIRERRRLGAAHPPHIVLDCTAGPQPAVFQNDTWNRTRENIAIFDDNFVNENIYSGLSVDSEHRQNLHDLIIGSQGVTLNHQLQDKVTEIEAHNRDIRARAEEIPAAELGGLSVDAFCSLLPRANIDTVIEATERSLAAALEQAPVRNEGFFQELRVPVVDVRFATEMLERGLDDLDAAAATRVQAHLGKLGAGGEAWVADGVRRMQSVEDRGVEDEPHTDTCPFCAQDLAGSPVLSHYRAFFGDAYRDLKRDITASATEASRTFHQDFLLELERAVRVNAERRLFWLRFCDVPDVVVDTEEIGSHWRIVSDAVVRALRAKQASPLEVVELPPSVFDSIAVIQEKTRLIVALNADMAVANEAIRAVKAAAAGADSIALNSELARLRATRARHTPAISALCDAYLAAKAAKVATETLRDQARTALNNYRTQVFPTYQAAINSYLQRFGTGFHLERIQPVNNRGGSACNYDVIINNSPVPIASGAAVPGSHGFHNTLSAGDRNALALAFFFASLDQDPRLNDKVVVIDDPISSLDDHRCLTTTQEIRRLSRRAAQVIVLSHSKPFLCTLWEGVPQAERAERAALVLVRQGSGSILREWDVTRECVSEHDRRHALLREYLEGNTGNGRAVAEAIRPLLESFLRVACPQHVTPGTLLGPFRGLCEQRVGTAQEILDQHHLDELRDLIEYSNRFHHDTNAAWQTELVNDVELLGFARRALAFAKR